MSNTWNEGYCTDTAYTYGYYREISPVFQRFCLLIRGIDASHTTDAVHCELGFGQGVSVNIHAASNPGRYIATDFNPEHATNARNLAAASGNNAELFDNSFEELLNRKDLPQFDSISLHGIWTWVSRDNHKVIAEFARRHLKPGGVFYNSYNCFPGWAPAHPLRQLFALHDRYAAKPEGTTKRVDAALSFTENLLAANPIYAETVPSIISRLQKIKGQDRHYLAHEYFNREWNCMYFTDVVDALTPAKLEYATSANPLDTIDGLNLKPEGIAFLASIDNPILREQARDYFINQQFRKDIYMRGVPRLRPVEKRERLLNTRFVLLQNASQVPKKTNCVIGKVTLQETIYQPIIQALASQEHTPKSLKYLITSLPEISYEEALQSMIVLTALGAVAPCQDDDIVKQVSKQCKDLNLHLCEQSQFGTAIGHLASPLTGAGIAINRIDQLFLLARLRNHADPASFVWATLQAAGEALMLNGEKVYGAEANTAEINLHFKNFSEKVLPVLKAVGIAQ